MSLSCHSGSNGHVNCASPQRELIGSLAFIEVCCACSNDLTQCIRKLQYEKANIMPFSSTLVLLLQD